MRTGRSNGPSWYRITTRKYLCVYTQKDVGPPKWRLPKPRLKAGYREYSAAYIDIGIGWRYTAYQLIVIAFPRYKSASD